MNSTNTGHANRKTAGSQKVVTYRYAYVDRTISLCATHKDDARYAGVIGPVEHGSHQGACGACAEDERLAATITEARANEIAAELLAEFGTKRPVIEGGELNDGNWSERADLSSESAFRAQCEAYRESFA